MSPQSGSSTIISCPFCKPAACSVTSWPQDEGCKMRRGISTTSLYVPGTKLDAEPYAQSDAAKLCNTASGFLEQLTIHVRPQDSMHAAGQAVKVQSRFSKFDPPWRL